MEQYSDIEECEYPCCDTDEALPVMVLHKGKEVEAWYRNPEMDDCWFESDTGKILDEVTKWRLR